MHSKLGQNTAQIIQVHIWQVPKFTSPCCKFKTLACAYKRGLQVHVNAFNNVTSRSTSTHWHQHRYQVAYIKHLKFSSLELLPRHCSAYTIWSSCVQRVREFFRCPWRKSRVFSPYTTLLGNSLREKKKKKKKLEAFNNGYPPNLV